MIKRASENQLAISGGFAKARILVSEVIISKSAKLLILLYKLKAKSCLVEI